MFPIPCTQRFIFDGFPEAVAFMARPVPGAESADHSPDPTINCRRATSTLNVRYHHDRDLTSPATDVEKDEVRDCVP